MMVHAALQIDHGLADFAVYHWNASIPSWSVWWRHLIHCNAVDNHVFMSWHCCINTHLQNECILCWKNNKLYSRSSIIKLKSIPVLLYDCDGRQQQHTDWTSHIIDVWIFRTFTEATKASGSKSILICKQMLSSCSSIRDVKLSSKNEKFD